MPSFSSASILVVDDSATMRTILRGMLARLGFRTIEERPTAARRRSPC